MLVLEAVDRVLVDVFSNGHDTIGTSCLLRLDLKTMD